MKKLLIVTLLFILVGCGQNTTTISTTTIATTDSVDSNYQNVYIAAESNITYRYYLPNTINQDTGFLMMLHGGYMDGELFMQTSGMNELADEYNFVVCYPSQNRSNNVEYYWNWYKDSEQTGTSGEIVALGNIANRLIEEKSLNLDRCYVAGFSAGACEALNVYANYSDIFKGVACVAGLGYRLVDNKASAEELMANGETSKEGYQDLIKDKADKLPSKSMVIHGLGDNIVNPKNSDLIANQLIDENYVEDEEIVDTYNRFSYQNGTNSLEYYRFNDYGHVYCGAASSMFTRVTDVNYSQLIADYFFGN